MIRTLDEATTKSLQHSLSRLHGQIGGIRRMIEEPRPCIELVQQLRAAQAATRQMRVAVLRSLVESHLANPQALQQAEELEAIRLALQPFLGKS